MGLDLKGNLKLQLTKRLLGATVYFDKVMWLKGFKRMLFSNAILFTCKRLKMIYLHWFLICWEKKVRWNFYFQAQILSLFLVLSS